MASRASPPFWRLWKFLIRNRDERTDGILLRRFLETKTEAASRLVRRHGPMVLGVCQRILGNADDADDAAQATFLVLATKANSLKSRSALGDWLHGVARRTALNARRAVARRREMEKRIVPSDRPRRQSTSPTFCRSWMKNWLGLPEKYRLPIVLCDLEGQSRKAAARQLRWPEGSVAGRLARGRQLLAQRLTKRGVSLTATPWRRPSRRKRDGEPFDDNAFKSPRRRSNSLRADHRPEPASFRRRFLPSLKECSKPCCSAN